MLERDDDDDVFEEYDAAIIKEEERDEPPPVREEEAQEAAADDVVPDAADISIEDFALLPLVQEIVQAHRARDAATAQSKMTALRRVVRRAEARLAVLQHATAQTLPSAKRAQEMLDSQSSLVAELQTRSLKAPKR